MSKVIAYLRGGLGNQCFIYAMTRSLADRNDATAILDTSYFHVDKVYKRKFMLDRFTVRVDSLVDTAFIPEIRFRQVRYKLMSKHHEGFLGLFCEKRPCRFQPEVKSATGRIKLDGYWQSEHYFEDNADAIYDDLQLKNPAPFQQDETLALIRKSDNSVFLHVRSYTDIPDKTDYSEALPVSYYANALTYISSKLDEYTLFVFSDDPEWARRRIPVPAGTHAHYVMASSQGKDYDTLRDFYLMQQCRHGIAANSSFSWWANWLGERNQIKEGYKSIRIRVEKPFLNHNYWPTRWQGIATM